MSVSQGHESALYDGVVFHQRRIPTQHSFNYKLFLFWLKLDEIETLEKNVKHFSRRRFSLCRFKREDYLGDPAMPLDKAVLQRMSELAGRSLEGDVFMLGQLRMLGLYFSPVNFFYLRANSGEFTHLLAEVSNTPWNERHHYLVNLREQHDTEKAFHVSPFNPMDMRYQWSISQPSDRLTLVMDCVRQEKEFIAGIKMTKMQLNSKTLFHVVKRIPSMAAKTVVGIYWQALLLWLKRTPVYTHPKTSQE